MPALHQSQRTLRTVDIDGHTEVMREGGRSISGLDDTDDFMRLETFNIHIKIYNARHHFGDCFREDPSEEPSDASSEHSSDVPGDESSYDVGDEGGYDLVATWAVIPATTATM